jgi:hypothetical protein
MFNAFQSAYTKFHSTETTLLSVHDDLIQAMDKQQVTGLALLDLSAAFDTIDHSILLHRLSTWFGVCGMARSWFMSYLSNRSFSVQCNGLKSAPSDLSTGVPQGSVLGPILFILYTTPLSSLIASLNTPSQTSDLSTPPIKHHLYADDTQLYISFSPSDSSSAQSILTKTIDAISQWMTSNFLTLNPSKTEFLLIGLPQQLTKLTHTHLTLSDNTTISVAPSARNLGITFDSNLSFKQHIGYLSRSCFYHIRDLRRIRSTLDFDTARTIATSLVHSKLDYCNSLYYNLPVSQINRLQMIQNSLARAVTNTPKFYHITPVLKSLHWLKIQQRIEYKIISLTFTALQNHEPRYIAAKLNIRPNGSTRSSSFVTLQRPSVKLETGKRSLSYAAPFLWNALPNILRQPAAIPQSGPLHLTRSNFHRQLKTHLFLHSFPPYPLSSTSHPVI